MFLPQINLLVTLTHHSSQAVEVLSAAATILRILFVQGEIALGARVMNFSLQSGELG
jgi:hypothetical protein